MQREQMRTFSMPHPLVSIAGILFISALLYLAFKTSYHLPVPILVALVIVFGAVGRWSAHKQQERRRQKLEELKRQPVLHLND